MESNDDQGSSGPAGLGLALALALALVPVRDARAQAAGEPPPPPAAGAAPESPPPAPPSPGAASDASGAAPPAAATPAPPPPPPWYTKLVVAGLVDTYYSRSTAESVVAPSALRVFDAENGHFTLAEARLTVRTAPELPAGLRLDLAVGTVAETIDLEVNSNAHNIFRNIEQAFATFKLPFAPSIVVDVGKFVTSAGAEVIEAKDNVNYSRSLLFGYAIPFTHTGVRVTDAVSDTFSVQASLLNGWDVVFDNNKEKTLGLSGTYASGDWVTVALNLYAGAERNAGQGAGWRYLADAVVTRKFGERFLATLNGDFGFESGGAPDGTDATWYGGAIYGRYQLLDAMAIALRLEDFQDSQGARTAVAGGVGIAEGTLTLIFPIVSEGGGQVELRVEARHDQATKSIFYNGSSEGQTTFQAAALAWF